MNPKKHYVIIFLLLLSLIYLKYENFCDKKNIETMSNTDTIINQIDKIYDTDVKAIRRLATVVSKLGGMMQQSIGGDFIIQNVNQTNELTIPYNVRIEGNLTLDGTMSYLPTGSIIEFTGKVAPIGWHICDGTKNGKIDKSIPDLRDRFIVGYSSVYNKIGQIGGTNIQKITIDNLPSHSHTIKEDGKHRHTIPITQSGRVIDSDNTTKTLTTGKSYTGYAGAHSHGGKVGKTGGNAPYDNRPPYYVLMYIIKE